MKRKVLWSTLLLTAITVGGTIAAQPAQAQAAPVSSVQKEDAVLSSVTFKHYNVLQLTLKTPLPMTDFTFMNLAHGEEMTPVPGKAIVKDGFYVGIEMDLDKMAKLYPSESDREDIINNSSIQYLGEKPENDQVLKITNEKFKSVVSNYRYLGEISVEGTGDYATNFVKAQDYHAFFNEDVLGDHLLGNKLITNLTGGLSIHLNNSHKTGYTYSLTNESNQNVANFKIYPIQNVLIVKPNNGTFMPEKYTLTAVSNTTGASYQLGSFTPFNIF